MKDQIDEIIMVGGSSRIPRILERVQNFFAGKHLNQQISPDESVCLGATYYAAMKSGDQTIARVDFTDVIPLHLGTDIADDDVFVIIPKNTQYPIEKSKKFMTHEDN